MKLFLDTADIEEIKKAKNFIDGITTNPTLASKEGKEFKTLIKEISKIINGPISAEVISTESKEMVKEAMQLSRLNKNIVVKIPMTSEGMKATKHLSKRGIKINVTLIFSVNQAILAAKAGATYASPFLGRLDDIGMNGLSLIEDIRIAYDNYEFKTAIIAASIRSPEQVKECALIGAEIATIPPKILWQLFNHPLTDKGLEKFLEDWNNAKENLKSLETNEKTPELTPELTPPPTLQEPQVKKGLINWLFGKK